MSVEDKIFGAPGAALQPELDKVFAQPYQDNVEPVGFANSGRVFRGAAGVAGLVSIINVAGNLTHATHEENPQPITRIYAHPGQAANHDDGPRRGAVHGQPDVLRANNANSEKFTVQDGDTFYDLENLWGLPHGTLLRLNPGVDSRDLQAGHEYNRPDERSTQQLAGFRRWITSKINLGADAEDEMVITGHPAATYKENPPQYNDGVIIGGKVGLVKGAFELSHDQTKIVKVFMVDSKQTDYVSLSNIDAIGRFPPDKAQNTDVYSDQWRKASAAESESVTASLEPSNPTSATTAQFAAKHPRTQHTAHHARIEHGRGHAFKQHPGVRAPRPEAEIPGLQPENQRFTVGQTFDSKHGEKDGSTAAIPGFSSGKVLERAGFDSGNPPASDRGGNTVSNPSPKLSPEKVRDAYERYIRGRMVAEIEKLAPRWDGKTERKVMQSFTKHGPESDCADTYSYLRHLAGYDVTFGQIPPWPQDDAPNVETLYEGANVRGQYLPNAGPDDWSKLKPGDAIMLGSPGDFYHIETIWKVHGPYVTTFAGDTVPTDAFGNLVYRTHHDLDLANPDNDVGGFLLLFPLHGHDGHEKVPQSFINHLEPHHATAPHSQATKHEDYGGSDIPGIGLDAHVNSNSDEGNIPGVQGSTAPKHPSATNPNHQHHRQELPPSHETNRPDQRVFAAFLAAELAQEGGEWTNIPEVMVCPGLNGEMGYCTGGFGISDAMWNQYHGYEHAADAPPAMQYMFAKAVFEQYWHKFNGDWTKVAIAWYAGPNYDPSKVNDPQNNAPSMTQYAYDVVHGLPGRNPGMMAFLTGKSPVTHIAGLPRSIWDPKYVPAQRSNQPSQPKQNNPAPGPSGSPSPHPSPRPNPQGTDNPGHLNFGNPRIPGTSSPKSSNQKAGALY